MNNVSTGWERLNCPFFESTVRRIAGLYFTGHGFKEDARTAVGGIVYRRGTVFIEVTYEPITCPKYSPAIILGIGKNEQDDRWRLDSVPLWHLVPSDRPESKCLLSRFDTESALVQLLQEILAELVDPYVKPLWLDMINLHRNIDVFKANAGLRT